MEVKAIYEATEFKSVKDIILNCAKCYQDKIAFVIKHKNNDNIEYENISYNRILEDVYGFRTELFSLGFLRKKDSYNWKK